MEISTGISRNKVIIEKGPEDKLAFMNAVIQPNYVVQLDVLDDGENKKIEVCLSLVKSVSDENSNEFSGNCWEGELFILPVIANGETRCFFYNIETGKGYIEKRGPVWEKVGKRPIY